MQIKDVLDARGSQYGNFSENAVLIQALKMVMRTSRNWDSISDVQREALDMIAHKIGRIICGNPNHPDSWIDIAGYATLAHDRIGLDEGRNNG